MPELHRLRRWLRICCALCLVLGALATLGWMRPAGSDPASVDRTPLPEVDDLREQLALAGHAERIRLLHRLGRAGTDRATSAIVQTLREARSDRVRRAAIAQLARIGTPAAVVELFAAAGTTRPAVRWAAVAGLGQVGSAEAVDRLVELLDDPRVRLAAIRALGNAGGELASQTLAELVRDAGEPRRLAAVTALGRSGGELALSTLSSLCRGQGERRLRGAAVAALGELGSPRARQTLLDLARSDDPWVEQAAVQALAGHVDEQVQRVLAGKARQGKGEVAIAALRALGEGGALDPDLLQRALSSADAQRRRAAVEALGRAGTDEAREQLFALLSGRDETLVGEAAWELARGDDPAARAALLAAVEAEGSAGVRARLVGPLAQLDGPEVDETLKRLVGEGGQAAAAALSALATRRGAGAKQALIAAYREGPQQMRWVALQGLSELAGPDDRRLLQQAAQSGNHNEAQVAIRALGRIGGPESRGLLERLLQEGESSARAEAARQLVRLGDDASRRLVLQQLKQGKSEVAWALGEMNDPHTRRELALVLDDSAVDSQIKHAAVQALAQAGDPSALLQAARHADPAVANAAMQHLGSHGGPETERVLREALASDNPTRRQTALAALGDQVTPSAVAAVGRALDEPATFQQAAQILGQTGGKQAVQLLAQRYDGATNEQRRQIVGALSQGPGPQGHRLLERALDDPDEAVAAIAAASLARNCGMRDKTRLLALMQGSPSRKVRRAIAEQLRYSGSGLYSTHKQLIDEVLAQGS